MTQMYAITEDELRYLVDGFVFQEHETTIKIDALVRSRPIDDIKSFAVLD